jgi:hypothetical protein
MLAAIPPIPRLLGLAGLLPMAALLVLVLGGGDQWRFTALAFGWGYTALIFSFLGGLWWGLAAANAARAPGWLWGVSVLPSLLALATMIPWMIGDPWPGPSLVWLGFLILISPLVDRALVRLELAPRWWLGLRLLLSGGLGLLSLAMGLAA